MSIPSQEAHEALRNIQKAERHSAAVYGYQKSSPHLILWGVIWVAGYAAVYFRPHASWIWPALVVIGTIGSFLIGRISAGRQVESSIGWRYGATVLALFFFFLALFAIVKPRTGEAVGAVFPIFVALYYVIDGIWRSGTRMLLLGIAVGALTAGGYFWLPQYFLFWLPQYFLLWMAVVGGGALILGGLWLRRV